MAQAADEVRRDIEHTRASMGDTIDEIEDRVRPGRVLRRRTDGMKYRMAEVRSSVMGSADSMKGSAESAMDSAGSMPQMAMQRTQGSPIGAGLMAFGAGLLAAAMLPTSRPEQRASQAIAPGLEATKDQAMESLSHVREDVGQRAGEAAESVKETAAESGSHMGERAREAADEVKRST